MTGERMADPRGVFTKDGILALHEWTHARLDLLLEHASELAPPDFVKVIPGFGQSTSVRDQLAHLIGAEERWVHRLQNLPLPRWSAVDYPTVVSLRSPKRRVVEATVAYLGRLPDGDLNAVLTQRPKDWIGELRSPAFILHHAITHAFHHKGQVVAMCRILGHPAPDTDLQQG
jgi:uncharacterized damage-inducible protein DinB